MHGISIKKIGSDQLLQLQNISRQTFTETFADTNSEEDMSLYLSESLSIERLKYELEQDGTTFFFAYDDIELIGYLKINSGNAQTELKDNDALEIERIYIIKAFQGKKAGQLLFEKAMSIAQESKAKYIWLGVWEQNHQAIKFYKKNGFIEFDKHVFHLGNDIQTDIMMKLELV